MTADLTRQATPRPDDDRAVRDEDVVHPLSAYVQGVLTIHFDGGAAITRAVSQSEARDFLAKQTEMQSSDAVTWDSPSWICWANGRVVYSSFEADLDQTWTVRPDDRRRLAKAGHERGVVASLVEFWKRRNQRQEPRYSIRVMAMLHRTALSAPKRSTWEALARAYEGERGAALLAQTYRYTDRGASTPVDPNEDEYVVDDDLTDDDAQPDDAASDASRPNDPVAESDKAARARDALDVREPLDQPRDPNSSPDKDVDGRDSK